MYRLLLNEKNLKKKFCNYMILDKDILEQINKFFRFWTLSSKT